MNLSAYRCGLLATAILLSATGCTWHVSPGAQYGSVDANDLVFPEESKAWQKQGKLVVKNEVANIAIGTTKEEIYQLIGAPHFQEGFNAREWDYILKFSDTNQNIETCRYKVIFGDDYQGKMLGDSFRVTETYWQPTSCAKYAQPHFQF